MTVATASKGTSTKAISKAREAHRFIESACDSSYTNPELMIVRSPSEFALPVRRDAQ